MDRIGDLEINQDLDFQRRSWLFQRIGWSILGLLMLAALAGVFGGGPLSIATAGVGSPLQVEYGRFVRRRGPTEMKVILQRNAVPGAEARIWMAADYFDAVELRNVVPAPESVEVGADRVVYVFKLSSPGEPALFLFQLMPIDIGRYAVSVGIDGGRELQFDQVVFP